MNIHRVCPVMNRRHFIKLMALASAGAALPWPLASRAWSEPFTRPTTPVSITAVVRGAEQQIFNDAVKDAARAATDFSWLSRGDAVLIKPALNSGNPYPATTSPAGVQAMVELLKEKGAGKVIVADMSGIEHVKLTRDKRKGSTRELMHNSGLAKAAVEAGAELHFPEEVGWDAFFEDTPTVDAHWKSALMMPNIIKEVDHLILMPRCARHALLGSSLGMKNAVGYWRTDTRLEYHRDAGDIQEKTADANTASCLLEKQRLVITVATKTLSTLGPDKGFVSEPAVGLVFASESIVAHDMISLAWLLNNRAAMSAEEQENTRDPYQKQFLVNNLNRAVVMLLGGFGEAWDAEKLLRHDIETIWDDRVLNRAYELFGGIPDITLYDGNHLVPAAISRQLLNMVSKPLVGAQAATPLLTI